MSDLVFAPAAEQNLADAFEHLALDEPIAAGKWVEAIEEKCRLLASMPTTGQHRLEFGAHIRSSVCGRYVVFFRPLPNGVEIVRAITEERDIRAL